MTLASVYLTLLPVPKTSKTSGLSASKEVNRYLGTWCQNVLCILSQCSKAKLKTMVIKYSTHLEFTKNGCPYILSTIINKAKSLS